MYAPPQEVPVIVAPQAPPPPMPPSPGGIYFPQEGGVISGDQLHAQIADAIARARAEGAQAEMYFPPDPFFVQPELVGLVLGALALLLLMVIGYPIARAMARRMDRASEKAAVAAGSEETLARLERIEHAVETMAVEIERISEGQRFTTRLLSEHVRELDAARGIPAATRGQ